MGEVGGAALGPGGAGGPGAGRRLLRRGASGVSTIGEVAGGPAAFQSHPEGGCPGAADGRDVHAGDHDHARGEFFVVKKRAVPGGEGVVRYV